MIAFEAARIANESSDRTIQTAMDAIKDMTKTSMEVIQKATASREPEAERVSSLQNIKFEKRIPVFLDNDWNYDRHWMLFDSVVKAQHTSKKAASAYDVLILYKLSFKEGGARWKIYELAFENA